MTLDECVCGDWVVVVDANGDQRVVEFGARLNAIGKKKERHHTTALVTPLDPYTFERGVRSATVMDLSVEVVDVIATGAWRRSALAHVRRSGYIPASTESGDDDPMKARRGGTF